MSPASTQSTDTPGPTPGIRATGGAGFTLVEMLVVLVVIALIGGVLMSAFERILDIRVRIAAFLDGVDAPVLVADWFRDSVGGLVPDTSKGRSRFAGDAHRMTGLSLAPLNATAGVPTLITWEVAFDADARRSYLRYRNGVADEMTIASWPGDYGGLRYCGDDFVCHDSWPLNDQSTQLPALILLDAIKGTAPWAILAAPQSDRDTFPPPSEGQ